MSNEVEIFLCGDVMTGRGIDQIMPNPSPPQLHESYVKDARRYIELAERLNGHIPRKVSPDYIWGDAMIYLKKADVRIINLETSITQSDQRLDKGINYRMHPKNIDCLKKADISCCSLANNHILDWGTDGLVETLNTLKHKGILYSGAGIDLKEASAPAILNMAGKGRVLVFSCGLPSSGIPFDWKASEDTPGVYLLRDLTENTLGELCENIANYRKQGDLIILSIHWGGNWGYNITKARREFAYKLIDSCGVDLIHGHSSHHPVGIEVYKDKPILYGCGDLINDYEGIRGHEAFKPYLGALYFIRMDVDTKKLVSLHLIPTRIRKFRLELAGKSDSKWLLKTLKKEGEILGTGLSQLNQQAMAVSW